MSGIVRLSTLRPVGGRPGIACALVVLVLASGCAEHRRPVAWRHDVQVLSYDVSLDVDFAQRRLNAGTVVQLVYSGEGETIDGWFAGGRIDSVRLNGSAISYRQGRGRLRLWIPEGRDTLALHFYYRIAPPHGAYFGGATRPPIFFTDTWPERMTGWLPVFDHPAAPVTARYRITLPNAATAVANGFLTSIEPAGSRQTFAYELSVPAPLYSMAVAAGELETDTLAVNRITCVSYSSSGERRSRALQEACHAVAFFDSLISPYPFAQYGIVAVPKQHLGMENAGLSFIRSDVFSGSPGHTFFEIPAAVQAHEAAHQWFGNRVMIGEWSDLWISEGFSTYLTLVYFEHVHGRESFMEGLSELTLTDPRRRGRELAVVRAGIADPKEHLHTAVYRRGASTLHLLRLKIGDEAFYELIRSIYDRFAGENVTTGDLIEYISKVTVEDAERLLRFWLYSAQTPVLHTEWDAATRTLSWTITGDDNTLRDIPFEMRITSGDSATVVSADRGQISLVGWGSEHPSVQPYGVFLEMR